MIFHVDEARHGWIDGFVHHLFGSDLNDCIEDDIRRGSAIIGESRIEKLESRLSTTDVGGQNAKVKTKAVAYAMRLHLRCWSNTE